MTVKELIKALSLVNPDLEVETQDRDAGGDYYGSTPLNSCNLTSLEDWITNCVEEGKLILY